MSCYPEEPIGDWMQTFSGHAFYPADPMLMLAQGKINVTDIAHALSMTCRYGGHVQRFYSVAEHSLLVSLYCDPKDALDGLLHDAAEAYMQDLIRPIKYMLLEYRDMEDQLMLAIAKCFGLKHESILDSMGNPVELYQMPDSVKETDNRILLDERAALLGPLPQPWHSSIEALKPITPTDEWMAGPFRAERLEAGRAQPWSFGLSPHLAKALWLHRFEELIVRT